MLTFYPTMLRITWFWNVSDFLHSYICTLGRIDPYTLDLENSAAHQPTAFVSTIPQGDKRQLCIFPCYPVHCIYANFCSDMSSVPYLAQDPVKKAVRDESTQISRFLISYLVYRLTNWELFAPDLVVLLTFRLKLKFINKTLPSVKGLGKIPDKLSWFIALLLPPTTRRLGNQYFDCPPETEIVVSNPNALRDE